MILSNTTQRPELDRKAITTLADTLQSRGSLYAAQFCYLMAQVEFSRYGSTTARMVLLGSNHNKPFKQFAQNESIYMTEIYEYACSLNDASFLIPEFQVCIYIHCCYSLSLIFYINITKLEKKLINYFVWNSEIIDLTRYDGNSHRWHVTS